MNEEASLYIESERKEREARTDPISVFLKQWNSEHNPPFKVYGRYNIDLLADEITVAVVWAGKLYYILPARSDLDFEDYGTRITATFTYRRSPEETLQVLKADMDGILKIWTPEKLATLGANDEQ